MHATIYVKLDPTIGKDSGPYDVYTDLDLVLPILTDVPRSLFTTPTGLVLEEIDDAAMYIVLVSKSDCCTNTTYIAITDITTTTTTTTSTTSTTTSTTTAAPTTSTTTSTTTAAPTSTTTTTSTSTTTTTPAPTTTTTSTSTTTTTPAPTTTTTSTTTTTTTALYTVTFKGKNNVTPSTDAFQVQYSTVSNTGPWNNIGIGGNNNTTCRTEGTHNFVGGTVIWVRLIGDTGLTGIQFTSQVGTSCPAIGTTGCYWTYTINAAQTISSNALVTYDGANDVYTYC